MTVVAPTGTDLAQFLTILPTLTGQINADIAAVGASSQAAPRLTAGTDLNDLDTPRTDWVTATIDSIGNVPPGEVAGFVRTFWQSTTNRVQVWYTSGLSTNVWIRFRGSSGWTAWKRMDAQYAIDTAGAYTDAAVAGMGSASASGYKTVPVALTVGGSSATFGTTSAGIRIPLDFAPTITRWRVHVRNINPRFGLNNAGSISLTGMWFGAHNGSGNFTGTPTQIVGAVSTPSDGSEYVSPWVSTPLTGGSSYLLAYGFSAGSATQAVVGGGWSVASSSDAINNSATKTALTTMPLDVWLEVEVPSGVPVVAGVGDSLMSGVGATQPVHDSTVSQYARANGALPMHYSASGEAASASTDPTAYKWSRWKAFARPDAALVGMGSNDLFGGDSLGTVQTNYQALLSLVSTGLTKNIYAATIMPRDAVTGTMETTRRSFNTWLRGLGPSQVRDVFDFVPGVSSDDETLTPALTADGIHLTTAGYAANVAAVTRVIAPPQAAGPAGPAGTVSDSSVSALVPGATSTGTAIDIRGDGRWLKLSDASVVDGSATVGAKGSIFKASAYAFNTRATGVNMGVLLGGGVNTENVVGGNPANVNNFTASNLTGAPTLTGQDGLWCFILSGYDNVANGWATVMNGFHNTVLQGGNHATISGGSLHVIKNTAYSTIGGGTGSTINDTSDGSTIAGGMRHSATGTSTTIGGGSDSVASSAGATVVGGRTNTASGQDSTVLGGSTNTASALYTQAGGHGAIADANGMRSHGARFVNPGDGQDSVVNVKAELTTATQTTLSLHGGGALLIPADTTWAVSILVVARRADVDGENAAWRIDGCIKRDAGSTTALVGTPTVTSIGANAGNTWAVTLTTSTPGNINVRVTGEAAKTIRWLATIRIAHVSG